MGGCSSKAALPADANLQPPFAHSGWLIKSYARAACVPSKPAWRKRWVVLSGSKVFVFKGMDDEGLPSEWMELSGSSLSVMLTHPEGSNYFELRDAGGQSWALRAPSELSLADWVTRFNKQCMKGLVQDMIIDAGLLPKATSLVALASPAPVGGLSSGAEADAFTPDDARSPSARIARQLSLSTGGSTAAPVRGLTPSLRAINYAEALEQLSRPVEPAPSSRSRGGADSTASDTDAAAVAAAAALVLGDSDDEGARGLGSSGLGVESARARSRSRALTTSADPKAAVGGAYDHHRHRVHDHELDGGSFSPLARQPVKSLFLAASPEADAGGGEGAATPAAAAAQDQNAAASSVPGGSSGGEASAASPLAALPPPPPPPPLPLRSGAKKPRRDDSAPESDASSSFTAPGGRTPMEVTPAGRPGGRTATRLDSALDIGSYDLDIHLESLRPLNLAQGAKSPLRTALSPPVKAGTPAGSAGSSSSRKATMETPVLPPLLEPVGWRESEGDLRRPDEAAEQVAQAEGEGRLATAEAVDQPVLVDQARAVTAGASPAAPVLSPSSPTRLDSGASIRETLHVEVPLAAPSWLQGTTSPAGGAVAIPRFSMGTDGGYDTEEGEAGEAYAAQDEAGAGPQSPEAVPAAASPAACEELPEAFMRMSPVSALRASVLGLADFEAVASPRSPPAVAAAVASPRAAGVDALSPGRLTGDLVPALQAEVAQRTEALETSLSRLGGVIAGAVDGYEELLARPDKRRWWCKEDDAAPSPFPSPRALADARSPAALAADSPRSPNYAPDAPSPLPTLASPGGAAPLPRDVIQEAVVELLAEAVSPQRVPPQVALQAEEARAPAIVDIGAEDEEDVGEAFDQMLEAERAAGAAAAGAPALASPLLSPVPRVQALDDWGYPLTSPRPRLPPALSPSSPHPSSLTVEHVKVSLPDVLASATSPAYVRAASPPPHHLLHTPSNIIEEDGGWFVKSPSPRPLRVPHTAMLASPRPAPVAPAPPVAAPVVQANSKEILLSPGWGSPVPVARVAVAGAGLPAAAPVVASPLTSQLSPLAAAPAPREVRSSFSVAVAAAEAAVLPLSSAYPPEAAAPGPVLPPPPPPPPHRRLASVPAGKRSFPSAVAATSPVKTKNDAVVARLPAEPLVGVAVPSSAGVTASRASVIRGTSRWLTREPQSTGTSVHTAPPAAAASASSSRSSWLGAPAAPPAGVRTLLPHDQAPRAAAAVPAPSARGVAAAPDRALASSSRWLAPRNAQGGFK